MITPRDPDAILGAWLDENRIPLPTETRRAIEVGVRATPQRRYRRWLPQLSMRLTPAARLALVGAAILALVGMLIVSGIGRSGPTPMPAEGPPWTAYTSPTQGFTVQHLPEWKAFPEANRTWFSGDTTWASGVYVGRYPMDATSPAAWIESHCGRVADLGINKPDEADGLVRCNAPLDTWTATTLDGHAAFTTYDEMATRDIVAFVDDHVYLVTAWANAAHDEALFDRFASTVRLNTEP
jgi:hypothetical protein